MPVAPLPRRGTDAGVKAAGRGWQCADEVMLLGLVEAAFFINVAFTALFVFATPGR